MCDIGSGKTNPVFGEAIYRRGGDVVVARAAHDIGGVLVGDDEEDVWHLFCVAPCGGRKGERHAGCTQVLEEVST
jgi:hypothetical protein